MKKKRTHVLFLLKQKKRILMKSHFFLFCILFSMNVSAVTLGQKVTLEKKNASLKDCITSIEKQTKMGFLYNAIDVGKVKGLNISVQDMPLNEALDKLLQNTGFVYEINNKVILLTTQETQQLINVKGRVTDKGGNPLLGATVLAKGTLQGTTTDADGNYSIEVNANSILVFTYVGMQKQEIFVSAEKTKINVVMQEVVSELGEVQLFCTGYQKIKPEQSTGSLATIRARDFDTRVNTTDILKGLENKIPGLLINSDIKFEGNSLFQIRGISTINGNKQPLIVMDGYPTELSIDMINPNEIESVTVLKDAAAATVYGVRASNGVIVIERKNAQAGKPHVSFRGTVSITPKENYDRYRWDKDGSNTYLNQYRAQKEGTIASYMWKYIKHPVYGAYYPMFIPYIIMAQEAAGAITEEEANQQFAELGSYTNTKDYSRLFLRTASSRTYNLDISGGNEHALYYIMGNYNVSDLSQIRNDNNRFTLSARSMINFSKRFSVDLTSDLNGRKTNSVPIPDINKIYPYERFQDDQGNPLPLYNGSYANSYYNNTIISEGLLDNMYYPLVDINEISDKTQTINNRITANFKYDIGKGFSLNFGGVYENSRTDRKYLAGENSSVVHQYVNFYTDKVGDALVFNIPKGSYLKQQTASMESYTLRAQMNYDKVINTDHSLNLIFGGEVRRVLDKSNTSSYFGYSDQTLLHQPVDYYTLWTDYGASYAGSNPRLSYSELFNHKYVDNRYVSIYSNVVYTYKGRYSFTGSIRIDQSNLFGTDPKYRYKPLWSIGAGWNIHKENFMQNINWIKSLKLRAAYGFNGNVAKNVLPQVIAEAYLNYFNPNAIIPSLNLLSYANGGLRWEKTRNFNMGLDYSFFRNITGSIDWYNRSSTDLLAESNIDASKGGISAIVNQASVNNRGIEISLHADWISKMNFNWNTGFIFSHNTSKVLEVYSDSPSVESLIDGSYENYLKGYAVGAMFNYRYAGLDSEGNILIYGEDGGIKEYSDYSIKSLIEYSGSSIPSFNGGLSNRVDIGNFYVYCMINFYGGFKVRTIVPDAEAIRPLAGANNYWREPGDEADPDILPSFKYPYPQRLGYTDRYVVNGTYFTLSDLTASYSFRNIELLKEKGISNLEVRLQASNLLTIALNKYNYSVATGSYAKSYLTPTYTMGLYVNF
jgi:TonB-linked SusC/RagA family outer membrane protein